MRVAVIHAGILALAMTALGAAESIAQAPGDINPSTQTQQPRDQTPINLDIIEKQKPEVEIFTGPGPGDAPPTGIVIVPEEAPKTPPPPAGEQNSPPKKSRD